MTTNYTAFYSDGRVQPDLTYEEALDLFDRRAETGVRSIAPTIEDTY